MRILLVFLGFFMPSVICNGQIFIAGKNFAYNAQYFQNDKKMTVKETLVLSVSGRTWGPSMDQKEAIWRYTTKKSTQTQLKDQFSVGWTTTDTTGIIESEQKTWIHPPRHNQYSMNEIAPFPDVRKRYKVGDSYQSITVIGNGFGPWSGKKIKNLYTIAAIDQVQSDTIWSINSRSEMEGKINSLVIKFSAERGFISLDYSFSNGDKETLILQE